MALTKHQARIRDELTKVGVSSYGQSKMSSHFLPQVIHEDEHIMGCVYGRGIHGRAMLIATDKRVIYLDRKPMYTSTDELTYDVVSGVRRSTQTLFSAVELHTRIGNYLLRYVNPDCARIFVEYIEKRVEHLSSLSKKEGGTLPKPVTQSKLTTPARNFLREHELAVLSTANRTGEMNSAVVNYLLDDDDCLYVLTKSETSKAHNMLGNHQVTMVVYDASNLKTVQLQGTAEIEANLDQKHRVFNEIVKPRTHGSDTLTPPVAQLSGGGFITFKITPSDVKYWSFKQSDSTLT